VSKIRHVEPQVNQAQLMGQSSKVLSRSSGEARSKDGAEARGQGSGDINVRAGGVGEQVGVSFMQGLIPQPEIHPEGG
jgi:hypothetical protein